MRASPGLFGARCDAALWSGDLCLHVQMTCLKAVSPMHIRLCNATITLHLGIPYFAWGYHAFLSALMSCFDGRGQRVATNAVLAYLQTQLLLHMV